MVRKRKIEADTSCNPARGRILVVRRSSSSIYFNEFSESLVILDLRKSPARQERRELVDIVISMRVDGARWKANWVIYIAGDVNIPVCTEASVSTLSENAIDG